MYGPIYDHLQKKKKLKFSYQGYFYKKKKKKLYNDIFRIVRVEIVEQDSTLSLKAPLPRKKLSGLWRKHDFKCVNKGSRNYLPESLDGYHAW